MRKVKFGLLLLAIIMVNSMVFYLFDEEEPVLSETAQRYNEAWDVRFLEPDRYEKVWSSKHNFFGDGSWLSLFSYDNGIEDPEDAGLIAITETNLEEVEGHVTQFIKGSLVAHSGNPADEEEMKQAFGSHPVEFDLNDYFVHRSENHGFDRFTAIYNVEQKTMHMLEWHQ